MWFDSSETFHEEPLNLCTRQRRKEDVGCFVQDDTATPPPAHQSSQPYLPSPSQIPALLMTPYAREVEVDSPLLIPGMVSHYQLNPVVTMLQQRIKHDTDLLTKMMSLHEANTTTTPFPVTEHSQTALVERSRPSYSYRARICGGEFVSDSQGNLLVTDNGQVQERGGELTKVKEEEEEDILDLSLEKNPPSKTTSSQFAGSANLPDTETILKTLRTSHQRPVFWNLLWALLRDQSFSSILCWTDSKDLKFKILNFPFLADTWGAVKSKENMDVSNIVKILDLYTSKGLLSKTGVDSEYKIMALAIPGDLPERKK